MKYKITYLVLFSTLAFIQCNNCEEKYLGVINFTQKELQIVPYESGDMVTFKDDCGDSIQFFGSGVVRHSSTTDKWYEYAKKSCPGNFYHLERNITNLYSGMPYTQMYITLCFGDPFEEKLEKYLNIQITYEDNNSWSFQGSLRFDSLGLYNNDESSTSIIESYNDSLVIDSNKYFSVYTLIQNNFPSDNNGNLYTVYYSMTSGIAGFKTADGHLWYLKQ
jgi:hypothetical protein